MDYDSRRYLSPSLTYSDYYPHLALSHTTRSSPHGYPIGGPVGEIYGRLNLGRDDVPVEIGSARRRIAVAVRCGQVRPFVFFVILAMNTSLLSRQSRLSQ